MTYRVIMTALVTVAVLIILVIGSAYWLDYSVYRTHENLRALVVSRYYASAARGEVAQPASEPGAVRAGAPCSFSLPFIVHVKTISGEQRTYYAERYPHFALTAESWTFKPKEDISHR